MPDEPTEPADSTENTESTPKPRAPGVHIPASPEAKLKGKALRAERLKLKHDRQLQIKKMNAAKDAMANRRALIKEKIAKGIPITEEELKVAAVRNKTLIDMAKGQIKMTAEPAIVVKPQTINALRVVVEQTAAKHAYNPIEGLLEELKDPDLSAKDRVAIHKTLLPFLMPQLGPAKEEHVQSAPTAPKITIKAFQLDPSDGRPIHESKKVDLASAVEREEERPDAEAAAKAFEVQADSTPLPSAETPSTS
jgi:hypothetical protein